MNSRQRILAALNGEKMDRVPITEIGIWPETLERWKNEGMPQDADPVEYFGLDRMELFGFHSTLGLEEVIIEENADIRIYTDGDGCTYKMFLNKPSAPLFMGSSVKSPEDWSRLKRNLKPAIDRFLKFDKEIVFGRQVKESQASRYTRSIKDDVFTVLVPTEPCWYYLRLLGEEEALVQMALDPEFAGQIMRDYNDFTIKMVQSILEGGYRFDAMWVFSDLSYKNGMLFSPFLFRQYVMPEQKRLFNLAKQNGMKVIYHSDGNIAQLLPLLIEAGIDCIQPLEARAGNDVNEYIKLYGDRISFIGNINMDVMTTTKEAIEEEIGYKLANAKKSYRYIYHSDHSVPDTVSLDHFNYAIGVAAEMAGYN